MYITNEQLKGFDRYKYRSVDTSPLAQYVLHPFWNQFVKLFPLWLAPNLITFFGFLLLVLQTAILTYFDPYLEAIDSNEVIPAWVWILSAIAQFFSHTLDGIDGKQARRTKTSSPLGELFDHGLDSWSASLFMFNVYTLFGQNRVSVNRMMIMILLTVFSFFLCHWEKYNTGVLFLPWAYDVSQVFLFVVYVVTATYGCKVWHGDIFGISCVVLFQILLYAGSIGCSIPVSLYNVYTARRDGTGKDRSLYEASLPLISPVFSFIIFLTWTIFSPSDILSSNPRLIMFSAGVVFSNITCRIIVAQMSDSRCQVLNFLVLFNFLCMAAAILSGRAEVEMSLAWVCGIGSTLAHVHYGVVVVRTLADHFDINVFSIKQKVS